MQNELKLFHLMSSMVEGMVATIPDDQFHVLPEGGGNSPNWIMGHLVVGNLFGLKMLGRQSDLLETFLPAYGPGSTPSEDLTTLKSKEELSAHFSQTKDQLTAAYSTATDDVLDAPRDSEFLKEQLPTQGDMLRHLLNTHIALHAGQMSAWRRSHGLPSML